MRPPDTCYLLDDPVWWCSHTVWNDPTSYEHEYYFDVYLDAEPFPQIEGEYYFINIVANYDSAGPPYPWGWKNSESQWNDDAVRSYDGGITWAELTWPEGHRFEGQSMDMAFELYVDTTSAPTPPPTATPTLTPSMTGTLTPPPATKPSARSRACSIPTAFRSSTRGASAATVATRRHFFVGWPGWPAMPLTWPDGWSSPSPAR